MNEINTTVLKIVLIGDSKVGKTNTIRNLLKKEYLTKSKPTVGVEICKKEYQIDKDSVIVQFWDSSGIERYQAVNAAYYRESDGVILMYDICSKESFENIKNHWYPTVWTSCDEKTPLILLGNKKDLYEIRDVPNSKAKVFADLKMMDFSEISAKTGENVEEVFENFTKKAYQIKKANSIFNKKKTIRREDLVEKNTVLISEEHKDEEEKGICC